MADFNNIHLEFNGPNGANSKSGAIWTGNTLNFGGNGSGANELRWATSNATANTPSSTWPFITRPASAPLAIPQLWGFSSDTSGQKISTYDGSSTNVWVLRWAWDNSGTFASQLQFSAFANNTHTTPASGVQPPGINNDAITNGSADTNNTSYLKIAACGNGVDASGNQIEPNAGGGAVPTAPSAVSGTGGAVTPTTSTSWTSWQSAQGWLQYLTNGVIPHATSQSFGYWYWTCVLYTGPNMTTSTYQPVITFQYAFS